VNNQILPSLYCSFFKRSGEVWEFIHLPSGESPTEEEIKNADRFLIPGSVYSAYQETEWRSTLMNIIKKVRYEYPSKRILGICYGG